MHLFTHAFIQERFIESLPWKEYSVLRSPTKESNAAAGKRTKPVGRCEKQPRGWKKRRERELGSERWEEGPGLAIENSSNVI